ncbi:hypothetical protein Bpfe_015786 [Biomphalaria pfeifferi]|uniref:C-type lectin domain-containing protein n=1 Tax=Biomphalaria pfeifferi TaxID=112525 RepID=A0AAD8BHH6_BIOPF|nr:hypothetical protein Bpfe_015786 [Biomphalaria pfeifferi]
MAMVKLLLRLAVLHPVSLFISALEATKFDKCMHNPGFLFYVHESEVKCLHERIADSTYNVARSYCQDRNSKLATFKTDDERKVGGHLKSDHRWMFWIGLESENGEYVWVDDRKPVDIDLAFFDDDGTRDQTSNCGAFIAGLNATVVMPCNLQLPCLCEMK